MGRTTGKRLGDQKSLNRRREGRASPSKIQEAESNSTIDGLSEPHQKMLDWLKKVRFRKSLLGGVSEQDVWKKLEELNQLYEASLTAERVRYDTMLDAYTQTARSRIASYQKANQALQQENEALRQSLEDTASST